MTLLLSFESICIFLLFQVLLVLSIQEIHADQEKIVKILAAGQLMRCSASVDILFLLDGSYSIGKGSFERSKHFAGKLCDALDIGPEWVRVGMMQFSSTPHLEFPLDSYATKQEVKDRIKTTVFRGGSTETGLALKYILHKGFPGGRNSTVPEILIILSDGKSQGNTEIPAKQLKERRITVFAVGIKFPRWEKLHALASEPTEQHVVFAGDTAEAANGFYTTLTRSAICSTSSPDCRVESHACERKTLETVKELAGNYVCWRGSKQQNAVRASLCPFYRWKKVFIKHPSRCFRTVCPDPCDSQPCQNGGTCVSEGLDKYYCLCPVGYGGDIHCAPKLSIECSVDLLFLMDSSAGTMLEGFLRFKAFLKRFLQTVMGQDSPMNVGVAQYDTDVKIPIEVGQHKDVFGLMKSIEALNFSGGEAQTGRALWYVAQHGFRSTPVFADVQNGLPRIVVLLTDSKSQDPVAEAAKYAREQGLFLIGIGSSFLRAELIEVTGNPKQIIIYSSPQDLLNKIPELQKRICNMDSPEGKEGCDMYPMQYVRRLMGTHSLRMCFTEDSDAFFNWLNTEAKRPMNLCKPNPCLKQGTLGPGSYCCECHGWEGPHCNSGQALQMLTPLSNSSKLFPNLGLSCTETEQQFPVLPPDSHMQQSPRGLQHFSRAPQHTIKHGDWKH
ncbi:von Willebrand factor A domain-containing protein 2 [Eudromia elegans]